MTHTSLNTPIDPADHGSYVPPGETVEQRLRRVLDLHLDPVDGSPFWIERCRQLGVHASAVRRPADLALLGEVTPADLRARPLLDHVPRRLHGRLDRLVVGQTGGTTGPGTWTAYRDDEFVEAFVLPFVAAARHVGFPSRLQWLFGGPSGPHVIGKVVRRLAASLGSPEPFAVDFDPRWARRLPAGSFARERYLGHVVDQAMDVIAGQEVGVLFTTPPVIEALAVAMTPRQRGRVRGIHYGGMALDPRRLERLQTELFPEAVHLSGYGNTLFGCCLELSTPPGRRLDYFPFGNRLLLEVVDEVGAPAAPGTTGRVRVTRLDETVLIVRLLERDVAAAVAPPANAPPDFGTPGVRDPQPAPAPAAEIVGGLY